MLSKVILRLFAVAVPMFIAGTVFQPLALSQDTRNGNWAEAIARAFQYDYQYLEQPTRALVQNGTGPAQFVSNPESNLNQHTFLLDLSQMFVATDMTNALKSPEKPVPRISFWKRGVSGLTLKVILGEHPRVVMNTVLPNGDFLQNYNVGGEADFDPAKVFYDFSSPTRKESPRAIDRVAEFIPKMIFKRTTPFDLVKYGGQLVPSSTQNGLNTIEFTWDARRILRQRTVTPKPSDTKTQKLCILPNPNSPKTFISVQDNADAMLCRRLAVSLGAERFQLGCASNKSADLGPDVLTSANANAVNQALPNADDSCHWKVAD